MNIFNRADKQREKQRQLQILLEDQIVQAEQVKNFFSTDLGKYIESKIETDIHSLKNKLVYAQAEEVYLLQDEFKMLNRIKLYFASAIMSGNNALQALNIRDIDE